MNDFSVIGDACFAHRIMGSPWGKNCKSLQRNVWGGVVSLLKKSVFGHRMLLKSKNHLDEILPLTKSQPLPREDRDSIYIVKDLSKKEIHYVIYSYQPNYKTRRYNSSTTSSRLWSVRIQDSKSLPNNFSSNHAHPCFDLERLNKSRSKTTTLEAMKEKVRNPGNKMCSTITCRNKKRLES